MIGAYQAANALVAAGLVIATGGLYAALVQGTVNGGVTSTSANSTTSSTPYFGVGAQISK